MLLYLTLFSYLAICQGLQQRPLVIGHRGSAYLPESTLATQSMAHAFGADLIEIDVNLSKDDQLIVIHGNKQKNILILTKKCLVCKCRSLFGWCN